MKTKIWIVLGGRTDLAKDYMELAETIKEYINLESNKDIKYEVTIISDYKEVLVGLETEAINTYPSKIIFISSYNIKQAREIQKRYKGIEVLVLAGIIPDDEVAIIPKSFLFQKGVHGLLH